MKRILITGMSGVGKSTLVGELIRRGYKAVDIDEPEWSEYGYPDANAGDQRADPTGQPEWLWRQQRVEQLLATEDADVLFVAGCAANQGKFYPRFDHVVLLTAPVAVTIHRLATRTTNQFGKRPEELAKVLADKEAVEPMLRNGADREIDTVAPLDTVVEAVLELVRGDVM